MTLVKKGKTMGDKVLLLLLTAMLLITGLGISQTVNADNVDRAWSYELKASSTSWKYFPREKKDDTTKHYVYWRASYYGNVSQIKISPYGATGKMDTAKAAGDMNGNSKTYIIKSTGQYRVTNCVKELGYKYATPRIKSNKGSGTVSGLWSPDSTVAFPVLY